MDITVIKLYPVSKKNTTETDELEIQQFLFLPSSETPSKTQVYNFSQTASFQIFDNSILKI